MSAGLLEIRKRKKDCLNEERGQHKRQRSKELDEHVK
jgi:hypothetical protein